MKKSKIIHALHMLGVLTMVLTWAIFATWPLTILFAVTFVNLFHPRHACYLTHLENKYREKEGLPRMKWIRFYFIEGPFWRSD
jgi:hypothetical protein